MKFEPTGFCWACGRKIEGLFCNIHCAARFRKRDRIKRGPYSGYSEYRDELGQFQAIDGK